MTYATIDNMIARFGANELLQLSDRDLTGERDDAVLQGALVSASGEIDGYLAGRYAIPLASVTPIITDYCCDIARYRLCGSGALLTDDVRSRYRDAIRYLEKAADGKVTIGNTAAGATIEPNQSVQFNVGSRVFSRDGGSGAF